MKILLLHNSYHFRGGEDIAVEQEHALLREHGHDVRLFEACGQVREGWILSSEENR